MAVLDLPDTCASIDLAAARLCGILRAGPDPARPAVGTWSIGDVANHLCFSFGNNVALLRGESLHVDLLGLAAWNETGLARDPERDPEILADRLEGLVTEFLEQLRSRQDDDGISWYGGLSLPPFTLATIMLAELLVHGDDIARASGHRWRIPPDDARTIFAGVLFILPYYVDESAAGLSARIGLSVRGGPRVALEFANGVLAIGPYEAPLDCRVSADPVTFMLVSYGRRSLFASVLGGKLVAWGRKPWLSVRLPRLLRNP